MSPPKPISNIHATPNQLLIALLLLISGVACQQAETRSAAVTTSSPAGSSTAPSANAAASRDEALVRVVHAIPNAGAMDVFAGDLVVFDAVNFKSVTSYRALDGKRYSFALRPAGMTNAKPLSSNTEGLEDGRYYTVFALPADGRTAHLRVVTDTLDRPADGKARLRIVHGGNGVGNVDVHASGVQSALFASVAFQSVTNYQDVAPVNGRIDVRRVGEANPVVLLPNAHLEAGRFYTMVIVGSAQTKGGPPLEAFIIEDMLAPPVTAR
jgi:Domain of unknown function (DUF4397)